MERKYGAWQHWWASPGKSSRPLQQMPTRQHLPWWALQTLIPDLADATQECRLMLTKLTKHRCIQKKKTTLLFTVNNRRIRHTECISLHQSDNEFPRWESKLPEGSVVSTKAEQVECITQDSTAKRHEAGSAALCHGVIHLPGRLGCRRPPGRYYWSDSASWGLMTITVTAFLLLCFGHRENPPLRQSLCRLCF